MISTESKARSTRLRAARGQAKQIQNSIKEDKQYNPAEAIQRVLDTAKAKFDETVELHIRLGIDPGQGDQQVRGTLTLPHGTGKTKRVVVFVDPSKESEAKESGADIVGGEELIQEIASTGKIDFDEAVATPQMMPKLAKIAKILGPKGMMPSPKNETVGNNVAAMVTAIQSGKISIKNDDSGNIHLPIGRISFGVDKLLENFSRTFETVIKLKPPTAKGEYIKKVSLSSTMGRSVPVEYTI